MIGIRLTLHDVDNFSIAFEDVDELGSLLVPDEEMTRVTAADYVLILQPEEVDVFDGLRLERVSDK